MSDGQVGEIAGQVGEITLGDQETKTIPQKSRRKWGLRWPRFTVDLSQRKHQFALLSVFLILTIGAMGLLVAGYEGFRYSESAEFCGTLCHPMKSEFVVYENSPHAKVDCGHCHVGGGVRYFIESKFDGLKSLYNVVMNTYDRPIRGPVHSLRPARDTCEECHNPKSFKDNIIKTFVHYDNDEANTPVQSTLILKMGGWREGTNGSEGIHWHIANPVYYIAADEQRQVILWVGAEQADGSLKEYYARDMLAMAKTAFVEDARAEGRIREMDCVDCHNRTAHLIPEPKVVVDEAIYLGLISRDLPYIRAKAVEVLTPAYNSEAEAYAAIDGLADYYRVGYPEIYNDRASELSDALDAIKKIYSRTNFPEMDLNWAANFDNEQHSPTLGCFRCHGGKHASVDLAGNEVDLISLKCNKCHTVPIIGRGSDMLVEAPVIVGAVPASHSDFRYTIEHRTTTEAQKQECYQCHGQSFCNNKACHNLSHPTNMLYTHPEEYRKTGNQVCYTCHQDIFCSRCHPGGAVVVNP